MSAATIMPTATANAATTSLASKTTHPCHVFLENVGIDSNTAPADLSVEYANINHSGINISSGELTRNFDIRVKGGQTNDDIVGNIKTALIEDFGARPIPSV